MKIAIINYSGNVGKTTLAAHMLMPRVPVEKIHAIETVNETASEMGLDVEQQRGDQFVRLYKELLGKRDAIIDVGASTAEEFLARMIKVDGSHEEIDYFLVPTVPGGKVQRDTVRTIQALRELGVPANRIRILFNRAQTPDIREEFALIFGAARKAGVPVDENAVVEENEIFDLLSAKKTSMSVVLSDNTDYRAVISGPGPESEKKQAIDMHTLKALSRGVNRQFDVAFKALFAA